MRSVNPSDLKNAIPLDIGRQRALIHSDELSLDDRILITTGILKQIVTQRGWWLSADDRIGEQDAAQLLGWSHADSYRKARDLGRVPASYRIAGGPHKRSVRLVELARCIELNRDGQ